MSSVDNKVHRTVQGKVVSDKADKTITVLVERTVKHKQYGKYVKRSKKILAHDENNECNIGDTVNIGSIPPVSKKKTWGLVQVVEAAAEVA